MKEELIRAAEAALKNPLSRWYHSAVIPSSSTFKLLSDQYPPVGSLDLSEEPCGEEACWFLLLCAEACDD